MSSDIYSVPAAHPTPKTTRAAIAAPSAPPRPKSGRRNYAIGQVNRLSSDFNPGSMTADQAIFGSLTVARNRARDLERNHNLVGKFLKMLRVNVIGAKGIRLQSKAATLRKGKLIPDKHDQRVIEQHYTEFSRAENFSHDHRQDRRRFNQMLLQRMVVDGEAIRRKVRGADNPYGVAYKLIAAELLDHRLNRPRGGSRNEIRMGIELDMHERPVAYYFLQQAPATWSGVSHVGTKHTRIEAEEIDHFYMQEFPGQVRGFTFLAPSALRAKMLEALETAVSVGYRVAASKMGFFKRGEDYSAPVDENGNLMDDDDVLPPQEVGPGELWELPEGLGFESFDPSYPNADFDQVKKSFIREIASGLGVSYTELASDFQGVSYSAGQIGVQGDVEFYADLQQFMIDGPETSSFRDFLEWGILSGTIPLPFSKLAKYYAAKFQPPRRKPIDAYKTHKGQSVAFGDMSRGPFDIAAENGTDFEDVVEEYERAIDLLKEKNLPIPSTWGAALPVAPEEVALLADEPEG